MNIVTSFFNYISSLNEANNKELTQQFNLEYQELYNRLAHQVDNKVLNSIKGRLFANRLYINELGLKDDILRANNVNDLMKIFDYINTHKHEVKTKSLEVNKLESIINKFPRKLQSTIKNIVDKEHPSIEKLKEISYSISNNKLAIEQQNRIEDLVKASSISEIEDILKDIKLITIATKWAQLIPGLYRDQVKNRIDEFAELVEQFMEKFDYELYKDWIKGSSGYPDADSFFDEMELFIKDMSRTYDDIIDDIKKYNDYGAELEYNDNSYIIAWIYSRPAATFLGSTRWCISYVHTDNYFREDIVENLNKQYIIWDFTKDRFNDKFKVGVTFEGTSDNVLYCHLNDDSDCKVDVETFKWFKHLHPLTKEEFIKYYKTAKTFKTHISYKNTVKYMLYTNDISSFESISDAVEDLKRDDYVSTLEPIILDDNTNILTYMFDNYGMKYSLSLLKFAYDNNKKETFNLIKKRLLYDEDAKELLEEFSDVEPFNEYIEYVNKNL